MATLDKVKAERANLHAKINTLSGHRSRLLECRAARERAEADLADFEASESESVLSWTRGGCGGPRPEPDAARWHELAGTVAATTRAAEASIAAKNEIDAAITEAHAALDQNREAIAAAAAHEMADEFGALGEQLRDLREQAAEVECEILAGRAYFEGLSEQTFGQSGKRNPDLSAAKRAAEEAFAKTNPIDEWPAADLEKVQAVRAKFDALIA